MRLLIIFSYLLFLLASPAVGAERRCATSGVKVTFSHPSEFEEVCAGVGKAISFLASMGFEVRPDFNIQLVERVQTGLTLHLLGKYDPGRKKIELLSFDQCRKQKLKLPFALALDFPVYQSFIVHEVTHAIVFQTEQFRKIPRAIHEYIAYIVQLATLPAAYRKDIVDRIPADGFVKDTEINDVLYCLNPDYFAVMSYKHFINPENGKAFMQRIRKGQIEIDHEVYLICR